MLDAGRRQTDRVSECFGDERSWALDIRPGIKVKITFSIFLYIIDEVKYLSLCLDYSAKSTICPFYDIYVKSRMVWPFLSISFCGDLTAQLRESHTLIRLFVQLNYRCRFHLEVNALLNISWNMTPTLPSLNFYQFSIFWNTRLYCNVEKAAVVWVRCVMKLAHEPFLWGGRTQLGSASPK